MLEHLGLQVTTQSPSPQESKQLEALRNQRALELRGISPVEIVCPKIAIRLLVFQHMEQDDQHGVATATIARFLPLRGESTELR
jgi:hypothetical protein